MSIVVIKGKKRIIGASMFFHSPDSDKIVERLKKIYFPETEEEVKVTRKIFEDEQRERGRMFESIPEKELIKALSEIQREGRSIKSMENSNDIFTYINHLVYVDSRQFPF